MAIIISGLRMELDDKHDILAWKAAKKLNLNQFSGEVVLVKKALDARHKGQPFFVCTVAVTLEEGEEALVERIGSPQVTLQKHEGLVLERGDKLLEHPPVVVGFGPAGMFAGLLLARQGMRPLILERGPEMSRREAAVSRFWDTGELDATANVQFGEGGAGTFSDGKLTTRIGDSRCRFVLEELVAHGAPGEILYKAKPHVGTDRLRQIVTSIRQEIIRLGGQVRFDAQVMDLRTVSGRVTGVVTGDETIPADVVLLAVGHSARDTIQALHALGVSMDPKAFSVGLRIEHLQKDIDKGLYGRYAGHPALPTGEYQLSLREGGRGVYTFCMCPGGLVVPAASCEGGVVTNGMSYHARDGANANAALVTSALPEDWGADALGGVAFQQTLESAAFKAGGGNFSAPIGTVGRFLVGKAGADLGAVQPSYRCGTKPADLAAVLGEKVSQMLRRGLSDFDRKLPGFAGKDAVLTGVETRTSSPLRIPRGENLQATGLNGLYPLGEGAGYAGGIISAAVDGLRGAQAVLAAYRAR